MARRSIKREITPLDPTFNIPDGVDDLVYKTLTFSEEDYESTDDIYLVDDETVFEDEIRLETPDNVTIIAQRVIRGVGGMHTIEITLEIEDVPGADTYETRLTVL